MKLEDIGFYTLSDQRAKNSSINSPLERCELVLTSRCNFRCPYCRGLDERYKKDTTIKEATQILNQWAGEGLQNVRFSGGEPTLWAGLGEVVQYTREKLEINRIALSTNGSADKATYERLLNAGVNDFSVSFDACCSSTADIMSGRTGKYERLMENISFLAAQTYVTLGVVLTNQNINELSRIIAIGKQMGVADIRIIPAAQFGNMVGVVPEIEDTLPILQYRINNMRNGTPVRGLSNQDCRRCALALDDMAVCGGHHFPCIIYLREKGKPIGNMEGKSMRKIRLERERWVREHNCYADPICRNNCLDVCRDYNNRWLDFHLKKVRLPRINSGVFDWLTRRSGDIKDLGISCRYQDIIDNRELLRKLALGWCPGEEVPCRPKPNQIAVMFQKEDGVPFWFYVWKNEFFEMFDKERRTKHG